MMRRTMHPFLALYFACITSAAWAYEPITHSNMSEAALRSSVLVTQSSKLPTLGLKASIQDSGSTFSNSNGTLDQSILNLIRFGADWEDSRGILQATRHFYNPVNGGKLLPVIGETSPDWALEDRGIKDGQPYSYRLMRRNFYKALTEANNADRDAAWGLTFQTMGQVMHHLQDMAQPQHVRGDAHCDRPFCQAFSVFGAYSPSIYEKSVEQRAPDFGNYPAVYSTSDLSTFNSPRKFWHTNDPEGQATGRGIAEFTNHNFISAGTNFDKPNLFPSPRFDGAFREEIQIADLCAELGPPCNTLGLKGVVKFFGNQVVDNYTRQTTTNSRMTTLSVFDKFLDRQGKSPVFSYNRANADAAAKLLVPRAVGYSAGMINYFFRGEIDIETAVSAGGGYLIRNNGNEPMTGRFALYYDDATDTRHQLKDEAGVPIEWNTETYAAGTLAAGASMRVPEFSLPTTPAPKIAGEFMLVFNGDMGEETRAMFGVGAVVAKQIHAEQVGRLFVLAQDNTGNYLTLRVDKSGTNTVQPGEFDPYAGISLSDAARGGPAGNVTYKYASFKSSIGGSQVYSVPSFGVVTGWPSMPKYDNFGPAPAAKYVRNDRFMTWFAGTPQSDEYEFGLDLDPSNPQTLFFIRRQTIGGVTTEFPGTVAWPGARMNADDGKWMISPDGLRIEGFAETLPGTSTTTESGSITTKVTNEDVAYRTIVISLGQPPVVSVESFASPYQNVTLTRTHVSRQGYEKDIWEQLAARSLRVGIGVLGGAPRYFQSSLRSALKEGAEHFSPGPSEWWNSNTSQRTSTFLTGSLVQDTTLYFYGRTIYLHGGGFLGGLLTSTPAPGTVELPWDAILVEGGTPTAKGDLSPKFDGKYLLRALTDRVEDAISATTGPDQNIAAVWFRNIEFLRKNYAADVSPNGEVFFALQDMSQIIHEPKGGSMPNIVVPANVTRILKAIWL